MTKREIVGAIEKIEHGMRSSLWAGLAPDIPTGLATLAATLRAEADLVDARHCGGYCEGCVNEGRREGLDEGQLAYSQLNDRFETTKAKLESARCAVLEGASERIDFLVEQKRLAGHNKLLNREYARVCAQRNELLDAAKFRPPETGEVEHLRAFVKRQHFAFSTAMDLIKASIEAGRAATQQGDL